LIGGVAYNIGFIKSLEADLKDKIIVPEGPEYVCAYGAALITN
jgi:activator of 2-hydroxyglutaryl-CoA dehydratase